MTDDEFMARLRACEAHLPDDGVGEPEPGALQSACREVDELISDPAVQANEDRRAAVGAVTEYLYRQATHWGIELPEYWR
jgi:hypothetical protein